jgi:excisionase family DNA binding protein
VADRANVSDGRAADSTGGGRGMTVPDLARRLRVGEDKIRAWIRRGELAAVNTASAQCGRPRWIIPPESLAAFERRRAGGPPHGAPRRRRRATSATDFYPD